MGKSSKKPAPKLDAAVPSSESAKQGKRKGEDELEKQVSTKKQKTDEVAEKQKNVKEIRSDDSSSYSEQEQEEKGNPATSSSSSEFSDDDCNEEKQNAASNAQRHDSKTVEKDTSSDISDDDDDDDDEVNDDDDEDNDDDDEDNDGDGDDSYDDSEKPHMVKKPVKDSVSSEDSEEDIEEKSSKTPQERVKDVEMVDAASLEKKAPKTPATLEVENATSKKICVRNLSYSVGQADMENLFKECGEIVDVSLHTFNGRFKGFGHVLFATEEAAQKALELDNTELLGRPIKVDIAWVKGEDNPNRSNLSKTFQTGGSVQFQTKVENATPKKICVRNLSYSVQRADMENLFKECGEIVDVQLCTDSEGRFRGFGHVLFSTAEAAQKALELDNTELLRRPIKVDIAWEKGEYNPNSSNLSKTFQTGGSVQFQTKVENATSKKICVRNLSYSVERGDMEKLFNECGEIVDVQLHTDSEGRFRGFGHVLFSKAEAAQKALELDNTELLRRPIKVDISWEKGEYTPNSSNLSKTFQTGGSVQFQTKVENATSKKICVRNLSYSVERADMENLFKECGEIVDIQLHTDSEGRFRGFGHVLFSTAEAAQKALEMDNTELLRRPIKVDIAWEEGEPNPNSSNFSKTFQTGRSVQFQTIFVAGFNKSLSEEKIKASLEEHFNSCGEIARISIPKYDSGDVKGFAHLEFKDVDSFEKALQLHKTEIGGYPLSVEKAIPRGRDGGGWGTRSRWRSGGSRRH